MLIFQRKYHFLSPSLILIRNCSFAQQTTLITAKKKPMVHSTFVINYSSLPVLLMEKQLKTVMACALPTSTHLTATATRIHCANRSATHRLESWPADVQITNVYLHQQLWSHEFVSKGKKVPNIHQQRKQMQNRFLELDKVQPHFCWKGSQNLR